MFKKCSHCNKEYPATSEFFSRNNRHSSGFFSFCKICKKESDRKSHEKYKEERHKKSKIFRENNKEKIALQNKQYRERLKNRNIKNIKTPENHTCPRCKMLKLNKEFYKNYSKKNGLSNYCKVCCNIRNKESYIIFRKERLKQQKEYNIKNHKMIIARKRLYAKNHLRQRREYHNNRKKYDIGYKIICNLRSRLSLALRGLRKSNHTMLLIGLTIENLKTYLESKFLNGMGFNNYGMGSDKWSIDHIIPCSAFDLSDPKQQKKCFHYTNLAPLWNRDNFKKNSLYNGVYIRKKYIRKINKEK